MPFMTITEADLALDGASVDDLYGELALAAAGTGEDLPAALADLKQLRGMASSAGAESFWPQLVSWGRRKFEEWWPQIRKAICQLHASGGDWIATAAAAIVSFLGIPWRRRWSC
jgi:hypothetical protein